MDPTMATYDQYLAMDEESDEESQDEELANVPMTENCDVIRRKIRTYIESGEMKVGEFQRAINVTSNAYSRFMGQNGPYKGAESSVYDAAWAFFKKRELRGIRMPKKRRTADGVAGTGAGVPSVEGIVLDFEMENKVPVFDTCDDIRRKINAHLKLPSVTQASFLRNIGAQFHPERKISASSLSAFRSNKGPYAGNRSAVFYGAYVYFEKLRIKEGKPKSKKREEMEQIHAGQGGLDVKNRMEWITLRQDEQADMDSYGRLNIVSRNGRSRAI